MEKNRLLFIVLVLFGVALGVRWVAIMQNYVIAMDATLYIKSAKLYSMGAYTEGFNAFPRSTLPLFIAIAQRLIGDWVKAGQWVSAFWGALAVIPLYLLARRIFGEKIAIVSSLFYIVCPSLVQNSAEVLRETPFIFFYITALWLGYKGIKEERLMLMILSGVFILLSASLKDYALALFPSILLFLIWWTIRHAITWTKALALGTFFIAGAILIIIFFVTLFDQKGFNLYSPIIARTKVVLIGIKDLKEKNLELEKKIESREVDSQEKRLLDLTTKHRFALYSYHIFYKTGHALNILLFVLLIFGLMKRHTIQYRLDEFLLFSIYATYIFLFLLHLNVHNFLQTKNTFPLVVPSLIWSSVGFEELRERANRWMQNKNFKLKDWVLRWLTPLFLLLICIPLLSVAWAPQRQDRVWVKELGTRLRDNGYSHSIIMGQQELAHDLFRMAFYAESEFIPLPKGTYEDVMRFAKERKARLLVVDKGAMNRLPLHFFDKVSSKDLVPIDITGIKASKYPILVFRIID